MIGDTYHDAETNVYGAPCLCIPQISGLTTPANSGADAGVTNGTVVYMHLTSNVGPSSEQMTEISTLPIIKPGGLVYGGKLVSYAARVLPKFQLEGFIDTPCVQQGEYYVPQVIDGAGIRYMYAEVLVMMLEGRANWSLSGGWGRLDPLWYRDPYGRVYNFPRILDFTGSYVEGIPQRNQFTMSLKV